MLHVDFTLVLDRQLLRVIYRARNEGEQRLYVLDQVIEPRKDGLVASRRPIVARGEGGVTRLVLGWIPMQQPIMASYAPAARALDPGGELSGAKETPWPLETWHPYAPLGKLDPASREVVLEVGYLVGEGDWTQVRVMSGETLACPSLAFLRSQQVERVGPRPLPSPDSPPPPSWTDGLV